MKLHIVLTLIEILIFSCSRAENQIDQKKWPYNLKEHFYYRTLAPININSNETELVKFNSTLTYYFSTSEEFIVKNTGTSVEAFSTRNVTTLYVTGGILSDGKYVFEKMKVFWAKNLGERSASAFDGEGFCLEAVLFYYKEEYGNFNASKDHRDGMFIASVPLKVDPNAQSNSKFDGFHDIITNISSPGSEQNATFQNTFSWLFSTPENEHYYAYPGAFIEDDGTELDCAVVLSLKPHDSMNLSEQQFQVFSTLKNFDGNTLYNTIPLSERGIRPVIETNGVLGVSV